MTGQTGLLARFAAGLDGNDLPERIQVLFGDLLLDYIRVASIGAEMEWSRWAEAYADSVAADGRSSVLFRRSRLNPVHATFLNATYAGSIDSDDTHVGSMLHPGAIVFSAALAVAQSHGATSQDLMAAVVAGYEAMIRIALSIQPTHFRRGFQSTATCGGFGAGVAAARLLFKGADSAGRIADTIGLVASFSGGLTQFYHSGSTVKRIHAAHAAQCGVSAALMVAKGFGGPQDILEGKDGFARAYADGFDPSPIEAGLGTSFRMEEVMVKGHACSARVQAAVEGMLGLRADHGFAASDIRSIRLGIPSVIAGRLTMPNPVDMQAAQMSLPFSVALAATVENPQPNTSLSVRDFERGLGEALGELQGRMLIEVDEEVERTSTDKSVSAALRVELASGRVVETFVPAPKGSVSRPYSSADHIERFKAELAPRIGADTARAIVDASRSPQTLDAVWLGEKLAGGSTPRMAAAQ
ncbi:MAG: MmgE/PrpD family protein [Rhizobiaceae bacterium]|nr:MmgE/PrpD family protein [Rhizobiaceae bacterium]